MSDNKFANNKAIKKVVFLDRDGVINRDSDQYIKGWTEFEFIPQSIDALAALTRNGFSVFLITNQSAVGRKLITLEGLEEIHTRMTAAVNAHGGAITDIFFCPHHPNDRCQCRKPKPGLILHAQKKYNIDLATAVMVGDSTKDILCARSAGCRYAVLVETGNGVAAQKELAEKKTPPDHVAPNLYAAVQWITARYG